jgi:hypothetical protein
VEEVRLDSVIPAAQATSPRGAVTLTCTAFRAPAWPAGVDVLTVRLAETQGKPVTALLALDLPPGALIGNRTVRVGNRHVLTLPAEARSPAPPREWGYCDDAVSLPGWGKPEGDCDPAFRNIRAGLGGVPIAYRFSVAPRSQATVALGLCESHWSVPGQRPLVCQVEGAPAQTVDPMVRWGRHKPGVLLFAARDANGDGRLDLVVRTTAEAADQNPILNAIWIFPPEVRVEAAKIATGILNAAATRYVDVGGENDQSIDPVEKVEYRIPLPAHGAQELTFLAACSAGDAPSPEATAWTGATLRRAAQDVWRDWPGR